MDMMAVSIDSTLEKGTRLGLEVQAEQYKLSVCSGQGA